MSSRMGLGIILERVRYICLIIGEVVLSFAVCGQDGHHLGAGRMLEGATLPAPQATCSIGRSGRVQNTQNVPNSAKLCGHLNCY